MLVANLRSAIKSEVGSLRGLGHRPGGRAVGLEARLKNLQTHMLRMFYLAAGMIVVLFAVMLAILVRFHDAPADLGLYSAFCGTGLAGLIVWMLRVSRGLTQSGLLIALIAELPREDALAALQALLRADGKTSGLALPSTTAAP